MLISYFFFQDLNVWPLFASWLLRKTVTWSDVPHTMMIRHILNPINMWMKSANDGATGSCGRTCERPALPVYMADANIFKYCIVWCRAVYLCKSLDSGPPSQNDAYMSVFCCSWSTHGSTNRKHSLKIRTNLRHICIMTTYVFSSSVLLKLCFSVPSLKYYYWNWHDLCR